MNENTIQDLQNLKRALLSKVASIDQILAFSQFEDVDVLFDFRDDVIVKPPTKLFGVSDSYKDKIAKVLMSENKFLHISQIIGIIHSHSPNKSKKDVEKGVNSAKAVLLKDGTIVKEIVGSSNLNSFYGSPNWLDENGKIKPEHLYSEHLVRERKRIEIK